ncbi:MAG: Gfo/Idh/MocA family oxidoreductase [Candidatus Omnitrophica bacterium]|nr:Gfo/Idh/MocA family oxidoreductase [Candidatus Omnitrophota bacterium]
MEKIKLGLIGYGYWGPNFARVIGESSNSTLKYCADSDDRSLERAKKKYPTLITTKDYRDILSDGDVKAVIIVTPTKTHYQIAKECILAKKHVFIEKPLCQNVKEAQELILLAQDYKVKLMVGHVFLFNSAVKFIKDLIDRGHIGRLRHLHFQRRNLGPIRQDVNVLWDLAPHDISMALHFIGDKPFSVIASGESFLQKGILDVVSASLKFPHNVMVNMIFSWIDPVKVRDIAIVGENKMVLFDDVAQSERVKIFNKNANIIKNTLDVSFGEYQISLHSGDILVPAIENREPLKEEFNHFIDCVANNKKPFTDGQNGLDVVRIISAIQQSLDQNSTLVKL